MSSAQANSIPNFTTLGHVDDCMEPLAPNRACSLAIECWSLRNDVKDRDLSNSKLRAVIRRLKFANARSMESFKLLEIQNSELEKTVVSLTSDNIRLQSELIAAKSQAHFQSRVIESNKRMISKLQESSGTPTRVPAKGAPSSDRSKQKESIKQTIQNLEQQLIEANDRNSLLQKKTAELRNEKITLQQTVSTMQSEISDSHRQLQKMKSRQERPIDDIFTPEAFAELEKAYDELHSKFEDVWQAKNTATRKLTALRREREHMLAAAARSGVSIPELPHHRNDPSTQHTNDVDNSSHDSTDDDLDHEDDDSFVAH